MIIDEEEILADLDSRIEDLVRAHGVDGCPISEIRKHLDIRGVERAGWLTGRGVLVLVRPDMLAIAD